MKEHLFLKLSIIILVIIGLSLLTFLNKQVVKNAIKGILPPKPVVVLKEPPPKEGIKILFLHHSTGRCIWNGGVEEWFRKFRAEKGKPYYIVEQEFPKKRGNYPYDYWKLWVDYQGSEPFENEPTLRMITQKYNVIIWKHCYPVGNIEKDVGQPRVDSEIRRVENYKAQYEALKRAMREFPMNKFIVWTGAAYVKNKTTEEKAMLARDFFKWVRETWDEPGDNIFLWDFYQLQTEGGLYFKNEYAMGLEDSHPNEYFSRRVAPFFCQRIVEVIEGRGETSKITGEL